MMVRTSKDRLAAAAYVSAIVIVTSAYMRVAFERSWFLNSDEYVIAAEIIRFVQLDFRQHFFDNPGTPFMMLNALLWSFVYFGWRMLGATPAGIADFTYRNIPSLFMLMRLCTLVFYFASFALLFRLCERAVNRAAAAAATLLLALSPIYASYNSFARTESMAVALILTALLLASRGMEKDRDDDPPAFWDPVTLAGVLMGIAAGARLHSIAAGLPALILTLWMAPAARRERYPAWVRAWAPYLLGASWTAAAFAFFYMRAWPQFPAAVQLVRRAALAWTAVSALAAILYLVRGTRRVAIRLASPSAIKAAIGCCCGFVLGNPTVISRRDHFFGSVQMYSGYLDRERLAWSWSKNFQWFAGRYAEIIAPDRIVLILICVGAAAVLAMRDRKAIPFVAAAALFFVSKPLTLVASPHHVMAWLPFFYIVAAYPAGKLYEALARTSRRGNLAGAALVAILLCAGAVWLRPGAKLAATAARAGEGRLGNIERASEWLKTNAEPGSTVAIAYFCFGPDVFYEWLAQLEVPRPAWLTDNRSHLIWWGHKSALAGRFGYACATPRDVEAMKTKLDLAEPGEGTDPYTDPRFGRAATFGAGPDQVDLFRFDNR